MSSDKGSAVTGVYVLDFSQEKPVSTYKISGDSVLDCKYLTSDTAVLVGSQASYIVKKGEKNYKTVAMRTKLFQITALTQIHQPIQWLFQGAVTEEVLLS